MSGVSFSVSGTDPASEAYRLLITYTPQLDRDFYETGLFADVVESLGRAGYNPVADMRNYIVTFTVNGVQYKYQMVDFKLYSELNPDDRDIVLNYYEQHKPNSYPYVVYAANSNGSIVYAGNQDGFAKFTRLQP